MFQSNANALKVCGGGDIVPHARGVGTKNRLASFVSVLDRNNECRNSGLWALVVLMCSAIFHSSAAMSNLTDCILNITGSAGVASMSCDCEFVSTSVLCRYAVLASHLISCDSAAGSLLQSASTTHRMGTLLAVVVLLHTLRVCRTNSESNGWGVDCKCVDIVVSMRAADLAIVESTI